MRLAAADGAGSYTGIPVAISSTGQTTVNVTASGTVTSGIAETGSFTAFNASPGTPSVSQFITVSGAGLTAGILVTPPAGFEVSADNITFTGTVTLPQSGGIVTGSPVYVRLSAADAAGAYGGNVVLSSTGQTSVNVAAAGNVIGSQTITFGPFTGTHTYGDGTITLPLNSSAGLPITYEVKYRRGHSFGQHINNCCRRYSKHNGYTGR